MDKLYTLTEFAEIMSIHPDTARDWLNHGKIESYRIGKEFRVPESAILKFLDGNRCTVKRKPITNREWKNRNVRV